MESGDYRHLLEKRGHPLTEGREATFFWFGDTPPQLIGDFSRWERGPSAALSQRAPGVWSVTLEFPPDAYMEYAYWDGKQRVADPLNQNTTPDGFNHDNHYFYMPAAGPTPLTRAATGFPRGTVTRHEIPCHDFLTGKTRTVYLYNPPVDGPVPLWVVWDGRDYLQRAFLPNIVDNLIARQRIQPVALALVQHGGPNRIIEYMCTDSTLGFLHEVLLPFAHQNLTLLDVQQHPGAYGVMGASMGGLMSLYAGLRMPHIFGHVLSQSGAFQFGDFLPVVDQLVQYAPRVELDIWMDVGLYEWLLPANRRMLKQLQERGYTPGYHEFSAGHNYPAWRDDVWRGLEALLPPEQSPATT